MTDDELPSTDAYESAGNRDRDHAGMLIGFSRNPQLQLRDLRAYCAARGFEAVHEYVDVGQSGAKDSGFASSFSLEPFPLIGISASPRSNLPMVITLKADAVVARLHALSEKKTLPSAVVPNEAIPRCWC